MNTPVFQLIYTSEASEKFLEPDLLRILDDSRRNNTALGVTGMLLYSNERFIQVLEGSREAVEHLYAKLHGDPRHEATRIVITRTIAEREFPDWSMGFRKLSDADIALHPEINDFFSEHFELDRFREFGSPARFLLLAFREVT